MAYEEKQKILYSLESTGSSVSLRGNLALFSTGDGVDGNVIAYRRNGDGNWAEVYSIAKSSDGIAVNSEYIFNNPMFGGGSVVTKYNISDGVGGSPVSDTLSQSSQYKNSIDASEDFMIVGQPSYDNGSANAGRAEVVSRIGTGTWLDEHFLSTPTALSGGDLFGCSVSIGGDYLAVGAFGENSGTGTVYIYKLNEETLRV